MPKSFEQLLDARVLTGTYRSVPSLMEFPFTNEWYTGARDVEADSFELLNLNAINTPAAVNTRGSAARTLTMQGGTKRYGTLFHVFNELPLEGDALLALREPESFALQAKGEFVIDEAMETVKVKHMILKEAVLSSILSYGRVCFDGAGEVLRPTENADSGALTDASGTQVSADYTIANAHRGRLIDSTDTGNGATGGAIIATGGLWSNSSTRISRQLERLRYRASKQNTQKPTDIYINALNKKHLRDNTEFKDWAIRNNRAIDTILAGEMIDDLWGWRWHFVGGTYTDVNGTVVDLIPMDKAIITPPMGPWFRAYRGYELVPRNLNVSADFRSALNDLDKVFGEFAYAVLEHNPVRLKMFAGDNWGVVFADPNAIWMPTVFDNEGLSGTGA